jgi:hypothetical protein
MTHILSLIVLTGFWTAVGYVFRKQVVAFVTKRSKKFNVRFGLFCLFGFVLGRLNTGNWVTALDYAIESALLAAAFVCSLAWFHRFRKFAKGFLGN